MKKILLLGAGLVSRPLVRYLLEVDGFGLTIATRTVSKAEALLEGHARGEAVALDVRDNAALGKLVEAHDLVISLLPYTLHVQVARWCLEHSRHLVTTSYVSDAMAELDGAARDRGLLFLNEIGVDPGIDHMSAMAIVDEVRSKGGHVVSFTSCCGGLPAPDSNDNPLGYKFSWSPRGVVLASRNTARFLENGEEVLIPGPELFANYRMQQIEGLGALEMYPNRDSVKYREIYGLEGIRTLIRGTYRNPGWCDTFKKLAELGVLDERERPDLAGRPVRDLVADILQTDPDKLEAAAASHLGLPAADPILSRIAWLGLFSDHLVSIAAPNALDTLCDLMMERMQYNAGERDMILMRHDFDVVYDGGRGESISSTLIDYGVEGGDSSMARTVSLPAAIATRMILQGQMDARGVIIPIEPAVYTPVLAELETLGVRFVEERSG